MKKSWLPIILCLALLAMPLAALAETMYIDTSNGGAVNMRSGPSEYDEILTTVGYGEPVEVLEMLLGSSWVNVSYNGYYGFIMMRYLSSTPPNPVPWPTFVPAPTQQPRPNPTARPNPNPKPVDNTNNLTRIFSGFQGGGYDAYVVPSTPSNYVNLRWAPAKDAPVRSQYWANATFTVLSTNGTWSEVLDPQTNMHGFMMNSFLQPMAVGLGGGS